MKRLSLLLILFCNWCMAQNTTKLITLGGGCFWCVEAAFEDVKGLNRLLVDFQEERLKTLLTEKL